MDISRRALLLGSGAALIAAVAPIRTISPVWRIVGRDQYGEAKTEWITLAVKEWRNSPEFIARVDREWAVWGACRPAETITLRQTDQAKG